MRTATATVNHSKIMTAARGRRAGGRPEFSASLGGHPGSDKSVSLSAPFFSGPPPAWLTGTSRWSRRLPQRRPDRRRRHAEHPDDLSILAQHKGTGHPRKVLCSRCGSLGPNGLLSHGGVDQRSRRNYTAVGDSDDLGGAASPIGVGETTVTPTRPPRRRAAPCPAGHGVGKQCRENYVAKLGAPSRLRYSQAMLAPRVVTAAARGRPRPDRPCVPPAWRAGCA